MANAKARDKKKPYHVPDTTEARVPGSKGENRLAEAGQICRTLQTMRSLDIIINPVGLHPHWKTRERRLRGGKDSLKVIPTMESYYIQCSFPYRFPPTEKKRTFIHIPLDCRMFHSPGHATWPSSTSLFCNKIYTAQTQSINFKPHQVPTTRFCKGIDSKTTCYKPCQTHSSNLNTIE